jgi:hypothetical protein
LADEGFDEHHGVPDEEALRPSMMGRAKLIKIA